MVAASAPSTALAVVARKLELVKPVAPAADILAARTELLDLIPKVLTAEIDFGTIPGTNRECLYKAGAERVCGIFGAHPEYEIIEQEIDHDRKNVFRSSWVDADEPQPKNWKELKAAGKGRNKNIGSKENPEWVWQVRGDGTSESLGLYRFVVRCKIVRQDGLVLGETFGSCSTLEGKYIDRPRDCENTALKMAQKRAFVGAALNAFGLSDRFTADLDDVAGEVEKHKHDDNVVDAELVDPRDAKPAAAKAAAPAAKTQETASERFKKKLADAKASGVVDASDAEAAEVNKQIAEDTARLKRQENAWAWALIYLAKVDKAPTEDALIAVMDATDFDTPCDVCKAERGKPCDGGKLHEGRGIRKLLQRVDPELLAGITAYESHTYNAFSKVPGFKLEEAEQKAFDVLIARRAAAAPKKDGAA